MNGPVIATIEIRRVPFDGGYAFDVERAGVPLEDHPLANAYKAPRRTGTVRAGLDVIGHVLDEIEQAGP
jgi:hypothetical protein